MQSRFYTFLLGAVALTISLFTFPTNLVWDVIDRQTFYFLNSAIADHPVQQIFWAFLNIKITDVLGALFLLGCFVLYIFEGTGRERRERLAELLYTLIWFEISILLCKQVFTPLCETYKIARHSPTTMLQAQVYLSQIAPSCKIKDSSYFCFPADHAAIVFQWCALLWHFGGWKRGLYALAGSAIFLLPRLISGAHWLSDLLVGSLSIVLISSAFALYTPLRPILMTHLYSLCRSKKKGLARDG